MTVSLIRLEDVSRIYRDGGVTVNAVDAVSLNVENKEFVMITGRSGSGKTTLLSLIGGLTRPTTGKVFFKDLDIWALRDRDISLLRSKNVGFVFQFASLLSTLNVRENLQLPTLFGEVAFDVDRRCEELLNTVGLSSKIDTYPSQLSGGEQRRVSLARALMNNPEVLLADEPTGDLDEETEAEVMEVIMRVNSGGVAVVMVTHNLELVKYAGRWLRMSKGRVAEGYS